MVAWVRGVGCRDECGVDGGGDMWSKKGRILKSEPMGIANGSEVDVRDLTSMTNRSSQVTGTAPGPLQVEICSGPTGVPGKGTAESPALLK